MCRPNVVPDLDSDDEVDFLKGPKPKQTSSNTLKQLEIIYVQSQLNISQKGHSTLKTFFHKYAPATGKNIDGKQSKRLKWESYENAFLQQSVTRTVSPLSNFAGFSR